jgi:hypothetical protein
MSVVVRSTRVARIVNAVYRGVCRGLERSAMFGE